MKQLRITYKKSMIGYRRSQRETMFALGLRKINQTVVKPDNLPVRGMIEKVKHLVDVEEVEGNEEEEVRG
jgi:large subunit ribosomal protein L30